MDATELVRDASTSEESYVRGWMELGVPVLVQRAGYRAAARLPDGRSTAEVPHVRVSLGGPREAYAGVLVEAVGARRVRTLLRADETAVPATDAASWLELARAAIVAAAERVHGVDAEDDEPARTVTGAATGRTYTVYWAEDPSDAWRGWGYKWADATGREYCVAGGGVRTRWDTPEEVEPVIQVTDRIAAATEEWSPLARDAYEVACARFGVAARSDRDCDAARFGDYDLATYGVEGVIAGRLAQRRERALREARERAADSAAAPAPDPTRPFWGASGVRYDEACDGCGRVTEIDNRTDVCRRCYG